MKKNIVISSLIFGAVVVGLFGARYYRHQQEGIAFDNSKPGLWKVSSQTIFPTEAKMNKQESFEICLTQEKIDETKIKPIEQKLDLKDLKCEKVMSRKNADEGEFSLICSKPPLIPASVQGTNKNVNPINTVTEPAIKIKGKILSKAESGGLEINYEISDVNKNNFKFQLKTSSVRVGDCNT